MTIVIPESYSLAGMIPQSAVDVEKKRPYTPPLLSPMLEGLGRRDATVNVFMSAFWFISIFDAFREIYFHFVLVSILSVEILQNPNGSHSIPPVCDWPALTSLRH